MKVRAMKMTSGEEFLCELVSVEDDSYVINNPVGLVEQEPGKMAFIPYFMMAKNREMTINKDRFVTEPQECIDEALSNYNQIYGSGIVTPNSQILHG